MGEEGVDRSLCLGHLNHTLELMNPKVKDFLMN